MRPRPLCIVWLGVLARTSLLVLWAWASTGCGVRTIPPIRYIPLLGAQKTVTTAAVLCRALSDHDLTVRAQAVRLLGIMGQGDKDDVKAEVARALGVATADRDPGIRLLAVENLGRMEAQHSNRYLLVALNDPNPVVREKVLQVLAGREEDQPQPETPAQAGEAP